VFGIPDSISFAVPVLFYTMNLYVSSFFIQNLQVILRYKKSGDLLKNKDFGGNIFRLGIKKAPRFGGPVIISN
jgi:hypothetical protein